MREHLSPVATRNTPSMIRSATTAAKGTMAVTENSAEKEKFLIACE